MGALGKIIGFFKKLGSVVSAFFVAVLGKEAAQQLGDAALSALKSALGAIVHEVVADVSALALGPDDKKAEAFNRIVALAEAKGVEYSKSMINLLIELAVQRVKGNIAPAA